MAENVLLKKVAWCKNAALFDAIGDWDFVGVLCIVTYAHHHAIVVLPHNGNIDIRAAKLGPDLPETPN